MLFKFTTTKPSSVEIWNTLSTYDFKPDQGYTTDQIRFICYCLFQLKDFKESKTILNEYLANKIQLAVLVATLGTIMPANSIIDIHLPPADFPHFVDEDLYIPYYMLMQLGVDVHSELWDTLFDREGISVDEHEYITANNQPITESITEYKLWHLAPSLDSIFRVFAIDESLPPVAVSTIDAVHSVLKDHLHTYLEDTPIYDYSVAIIIPPFKLRSADVPQ